MKQKNFELLDLFCGAGGSSTGAVEAANALGYRVKLTAVNHWDVAIATHTKNHPSARNMCTSVDDLSPSAIYGKKVLDMLWASPQCTWHSNARGGKPINDQQRATAWCVVRWAESKMPRRILVENVPEFVKWGPVDKTGRPIKEKSGEIFMAWLNALKAFGYTVEHKVLCAADYGDPTIRRRLFVQAVLPPLKIVWPEATHASKETMAVGLKPHVPARDIIDWECKGSSIFERKKPLAKSTMNRIVAGLKKFGLKPFILPHQGVNPHMSPARDVKKPLNTVTATHGAGRLAVPFLVAIDHTGGNGDQVRSTEKPLSTVTSKARHVLCEPFLLPQMSGGRNRTMDEPVPTLTTTSRGVGVVQPYLVNVCHGNGEDKSPKADIRRTRSLDVPVPVITTANQWAIVQPFLIKYYGTGISRSVDIPLDTVTCKDRFGLVKPMIKMDGKNYVLDIMLRMLQPNELSLAQGFPKDYVFTGNKNERTKQIGNSVPVNTARALVAAVLNQKSYVGKLFAAGKK